MTDAQGDELLEEEVGSVVVRVLRTGGPDGILGCEVWTVCRGEACGPECDHGDELVSFARRALKCPPCPARMPFGRPR